MYVCVMQIITRSSANAEGPRDASQGMQQRNDLQGHSRSLCVRVCVRACMYACIVLVSFRGIGVTQVHRQRHHPVEDFLFNFNISYVSILYCFHVIANYFLKVADFNLSHLHLVLLLGVTPFEFHGNLWRQKISPWAIVWCCLHDPMFNHFDIIPVGQKNGQMDRWMDTRQWLIPC